MAEDPRLDPISFLDRFFDEIREEARENPKFADRLVKSLGGQVVFEDATKTDIANPFLLAANANKSDFYATFSSLKASQLKRLLKEHNLASAIDVRGKSPSQLVDMLYNRASLKISERKSSYF
jgi:hypothetical protein